MANFSDDDVAATRIHHADGSDSGMTEVKASAAVVNSVLSRFNPEAPSFSSAESAWISGMLALSAPPS